MKRAAWDMRRLGGAPAVRPAEGIEADGARGVFFDGLPYRGRPTRVFAWLAMPKPRRGPKAPGIVLVHGGAGSAFARWARQWADRGYAAIAMDTCGCVPDGGKIAVGVRHEAGGPPGFGGIDQLDEPIGDQWPYHAVGDVVLAHSLLRAQPGVDAGRIGLLGISWGGYLASVVAGVDRRFRFGVPVYGCGYLYPSRDFKGIFADKPERQRRRWFARWDPSNFLAGCRFPLLWINGTNDLAFPLSSFQRSYRLARGERTVCVKVRMRHNYSTPWATKEIAAYADGMVGRGRLLAGVLDQGLEGGRAWVSFRSPARIVKARLCYTRQGGPWLQRRWLVRAASLDSRKAEAWAQVPAGACVCFLSLIDERGLIVSGEHVELPRGRGRP